MPKKKLNQIKVTYEGKEIPFRDFVHEVGGSGTLYESDIREMFMNWKLADFAYVDDYIAHLAAMVIISASELDRTLYNEIMTVVEKAYISLRPEIDENYPTLTVVK